MIKQLEVVTFRSKKYFLDDRLREMRNTLNPSETIKYSKIEVCGYCCTFYYANEVEQDQSEEGYGIRYCPKCNTLTSTLESAQGC